VPVTSVLLVLAACRLPPPDETQTQGGVLVVNDDAAVFDVLDIGADPPATQEVWISNAGPGALTVAAPRIDRDGAFTVAGAPVVLQPADAYAYSITFDPQTPFVHDAVLVIDSDAAGPPVTEVGLQGEALAPILELDGGTLDLGTVAVGCSSGGSVVVRNSGNETLEIAPELVGSPELALADGTDAVSIDAGEMVSIGVWYVPVDGTEDMATLTLESSDPIRPHAEVVFRATGTATLQRVDWFDGGANLAADIVFVVDNSGSMTEEQAALASNMGAFVDGLEAGGVDYRIGVVTTDASEFVGDVFTNTTPDGATVLSDQVAALGVAGNGTERGLQMLYACVDGSDCSEASGFLRPDALFNGIVVTDEPDQSAQAPKSYVNALWKLKSDPTLVRIDAIAGEVPVPTCGTCASAGFGYDEAASLTDGHFLNVCGDWGENLLLIATSATVSRFALSKTPDVDTIEVLVDGLPAAVGSWTYVDFDEGIWVNAIEFALGSDPAPGADIQVRYDVAAECE